MGEEGGADVAHRSVTPEPVLPSLHDSLRFLSTSDGSVTLVEEGLPEKRVSAGALVLVRLAGLAVLVGVSGRLGDPPVAVAVGAILRPKVPQFRAHSDAPGMSTPSGKMARRLMSSMIGSSGLNIS